MLKLIAAIAIFSTSITNWTFANNNGSVIKTIISSADELTIESSASEVTSPLLLPDPPNWVPLENPLYNQNVIGKIQYCDAGISLDENDIIGAFYGSECRGIANPSSSLDGVFFLTIRSNVEAGEEITFKVYDSSADQIFGAACDIDPWIFQNSSDVGTLNDPKIFTTDNCTDDLSLTLLSGTLNGSSISPASPELVVTVGHSITGSLSFDADNHYLTAGQTMPFSWTPGWGTHSTSYSEVASWVPHNTVTNYNVSVNLTAPASPGTYY